jgi:hypothetical protein
MAQNFRRYIARNVGTSAVTLVTATTYNTVIGIKIANTTASTQALVDVYITTGGNNYYLGKTIPVPAGSSLELIEGKVVIQSGDVLKIVSDTATSLDVWVSTVDDISA